MTIPDLLLAVLIAAVFAVMVLPYVKKLGVTETVNGLKGYAAKVDILTKECRVSYENEPDIEEVIRRIQRAGFYVSVKDK